LPEGVPTDKDYSFAADQTVVEKEVTVANGQATAVVYPLDCGGVVGVTAKLGEPEVHYKDPKVNPADPAEITNPEKLWIPSPRKGYEPEAPQPYLPRAWVEQYQDVPWPDPPYADVNWDEEPREQMAAEPGAPNNYVDMNGNGQYDAAFPVQHAGTGDIYVAWIEYRGFITGGADSPAVIRLKPTRKEIVAAVYVMDGPPEPYTDTNGNGQYDEGEPYTDSNGNGQWDAMPMIVDWGTVGHCMNWADVALASAGVDLYRRDAGRCGRQLPNSPENNTDIITPLFNDWWPRYVGVVFEDDHAIPPQDRRHTWLDWGSLPLPFSGRRHVAIFVNRVRAFLVRMDWEAFLDQTLCFKCAHELGHVVDMRDLRDEDPTHWQIRDETAIYSSYIMLYHVEPAIGTKAPGKMVVCREWARGVAGRLGVGEH